MATRSSFNPCHCAFFTAYFPPHSFYCLPWNPVLDPLFQIFWSSEPLNMQTIAVFSLKFHSLNIWSGCLWFPSELYHPCIPEIELLACLRSQVLALASPVKWNDPVIQALESWCHTAIAYMDIYFTSNIWYSIFNRDHLWPDPGQHFRQKWSVHRSSWILRSLDWAWLQKSSSIAPFLDGSFLEGRTVSFWRQNGTYEST